MQPLPSPVSHPCQWPLSALLIQRIVSVDHQSNTEMIIALSRNVTHTFHPLSVKLQWPNPHSLIFVVLNSALYEFCCFARNLPLYTNLRLSMTCSHALAEVANSSRDDVA